MGIGGPGMVGVAESRFVYSADDMSFESHKIDVLLLSFWTGSGDIQTRSLFSCFTLGLGSRRSQPFLVRLPEDELRGVRL